MGLNGGHNNQDKKPDACGPENRDRKRIPCNIRSATDRKWTEKKLSLPAPGSSLIAKKPRPVKEMRILVSLSGWYVWGQD